jgi:hypothetical protein
MQERGWLARAERGAGIVMTVAACALQLVVWSSAGALWRDEVVTVTIAGEPTVGRLWGDLVYESSPALVHFLLRGWIGLGLGDSDAGLRAFGALVGIGVLAALWADARLLGFRAPLVSLATFALCGLTMRATASLRAYGVGIVCVLLAFGLVWRLIEAPSARRFVAASAIMVLAVQALYQNAFLVLAICAGGALVALGMRRPWRVAAVGGAGLVAASSLVVYAGTLHRLGELKTLYPHRVPLSQMGAVLVAALADGGAVMPWVWAALAAGALGVAVRTRGGRVAFAGLTAVAAVGAFLCWLRILGFPTQPWYYLPLIAIVAVALDTILAAAPVVRLCVALAIFALAGRAAFDGAGIRQTNVDLLAQKLESVPADDVIVVHPWYCGASFQRYYRGRAAWATLPPLGDQRLQRLDLFRDFMTAAAPIAPVVDAMGAALRGGHRVWLVGSLPFLEQGQTPPALRPAPDPTWGWDHDAYADIWGAQAAYFLQTNAHAVGVVPVVAGQPVNPLEDLPLVVAEGWRTPAAP